MQCAQEIEALFILEHILQLNSTWTTPPVPTPFIFGICMYSTSCYFIKRRSKHAFSFRRLVAAGSVDSRTLYCELNDKKGLSVTATLGSRAATWLVVTGLMKICFQIFYPRAVFMFKYSVGRSWLDAGRQNSIDPSFVVLGSPISHVEPFLKWLIFLYVTT